MFSWVFNYAYVGAVLVLFLHFFIKDNFAKKSRSKSKALSFQPFARSWQRTKKASTCSLPRLAMPSRSAAESTRSMPT